MENWIDMQPNVDYLDLLKKCLTASLYEESAWRLVEGPMPDDHSLIARLKRKLVLIARNRGLALIRTEAFNSKFRDNGLDWPLFGMTMVGTKRLDNIQYCVEQILHQGILGDFVETGVWRGGSSIFAKALFRQYGESERVVWCCDSFEGMPIPSSADLSIDPKSDFSDRVFLVATQDRVEENFRKFGLLDHNVRFLKGWFCDTLPTAPIDKIAILRMDGDLFDSTMDALTYLYEKVSVGGYVLVDDYKSWKGCRRAVDEFREINGINEAVVDVDPHAVFWKKTQAR